MQIVIDIPDKKYEWLRKNNPKPDNKSIIGCIVAGTPLPKGHGRLIDADMIIDIIDKEYPNLDRQDIKQWIENAPTIVEADKEVKHG